MLSARIEEGGSEARAKLGARRRGALDRLAVQSRNEGRPMEAEIYESMAKDDALERRLGEVTRVPDPKKRPILVQKYGGSSVADVEKIGRVADRVAAAKRAGHDVVVVVSAMGKTTDGLLALARQVAAHAGEGAEPPRRELDMLLSTGERVSMALLSIAIQARGLEAISFTGSQSGILTNDRHFDARIIEVRPHRIEDELARGKIVIVAGYQGMSYRREITTLGRGGSDTTAVALAAALERRALRDLQRRRRRLLGRSARRARRAPPARARPRDAPGDGRVRREGRVRAGRRVGAARRHRHLRAEHLRHGRRDARARRSSAASPPPSASPRAPSPPRRTSSFATTTTPARSTRSSAPPRRRGSP